MDKFNLTRGCICDSLTINDKQEVDMSDEERKAYMDKISKWILDSGNFNYFLASFIEDFGDFDCDDEPCECCGDTVCYWNLEI